MKLCFSTLGCPAWSFQEIVTTAGDLGYQGIEIRGVHRELFAPDIPQFQGEQAGKTYEMLQKKGLSIPCLTSDSVLHIAPFHDKTLKELTAYINLARKLQTPYIRVLGDNPQPWPGAAVDEGFIKEIARELAPIAAANGVTLLIETNGWFADTARLAKLLQSINHPAIAALWDVHHPYRYNNETAKDTYDNIGPWIRHTHFKDSTLSDRVHYTTMGYGDLPLDAFVHVLKSNDYQGFYSLEWVRRWDLTLEMPGIVFAQYVSFMNSL